MQKYQPFVQVEPDRFVEDFCALNVSSNGTVTQTIRLATDRIPDVVRALTEYYDGNNKREINRGLYGESNDGRER